MTAPIPPEGLEMNHRTLCPRTSTWKENSLECDNIALGDEVPASKISLIHFLLKLYANVCKSEIHNNLNTFLWTRLLYLSRTFGLFIDNFPV